MSTRFPKRLGDNGWLAGILKHSKTDTDRVGLLPPPNANSLDGFIAEKRCGQFGVADELTGGDGRGGANPT